jgi:zinc transporter ZupT
MQNMIWLQAIIIVLFVLIHLFAERFHITKDGTRSAWLSFAGGVSVSYVFIHIFPELEQTQRHLSLHFNFIPFVEHHAYIVALLGLIVFYGLERGAKLSQSKQTFMPDHTKSTTSQGVFLLHISSFAIYNALIGYLLVHREEQDLYGLIFFSIAMGLHFFVNDYSLRQFHRDTYKKCWRWVLCGMIVVGWCIGLATKISEAMTGVLFAFLAGGVILNVLKEELPEEKQSRFWAFASGATVYTVLLLLL